jgi:hypothetical protein
MNSSIDSNDPKLTERGAHNPYVVDLIRRVTSENSQVDSFDEIELVIMETREWGCVPQQIEQIEDKINRYLSYILDGFIFQHYPQYQGKKITIVFEHLGGNVSVEEERFLNSIKTYFQGISIGYKELVISKN